ncbi:MAG: hypothetical protein KDG54_03425 [Geminicoccaceae bacterium]|nr:hypothetical protein [Geminicoccaceae bacterium]
MSDAAHGATRRTDRMQDSGVRRAGGLGRLKGRVVRARRLIKNGEEELRTGIGAIARTIGLERQARANGLFEPRGFEMRSYPCDVGGVRAQVVTPAGEACMHTFFDVQPLSASGRYLAVTRLPFEHRGPYPGDMAEICVIDLTDQTIETVYRTGGWALQLGANIQWHPTDDRFLFCNDLGAGRGVGVMIDREDRTSCSYAAPFYAIEPTGQGMLGPALDLVNRTQYGYGVPETVTGRRSLRPGAARDEGIWRTDLGTGRVELLASIHDLVQASPDRDLLMTGTNILFHTKIHEDGGRIFQVLRSMDLVDRPGAVRSRIMTLDADGSGIRELLPHRDWDRGGHHPSWMSGARRVLMNLVPERGGEMRFVILDDDGSGCRQVLDDWRGSGHPSIEARGRYLVTDAYLNEGFGEPDGKAPLRLIDLRDGIEHHIMQLDCGPPNLRARRIDPHPVWGRDGRSVIVNGVVDGRRAVMIADLSEFFGAQRK